LALEALVTADRWVVTALLTCVAAAAGLALDARRLRRGAPKMLGAAAATWAATFAVSAGALAMVSRGSPGGAVAVLGISSLATLALYVVGRLVEPESVVLQRRFATGARLSLREAVELFELRDAEGALHREAVEKILAQLYPAIGEFQHLREVPAGPHGYRRMV